jgi:hypothetical protein
MVLEDNIIMMEQFMKEGWKMISSMVKGKRLCQTNMFTKESLNTERGMGKAK